MSDTNKNLIQFVWVVIAFNAIFVGSYFSGIGWLQQLIAPTIDKANFQYEQMREFGVLEMTQNVFLFSIVFLLLQQVLKRQDWLEKGFYFIGFALFAFIFIEEIDYGLHIYKYFSGELGDVQYFSWHNQWDDGVENATRVKKLADLVGGLWFIIVPLVFLIPVLKKLKHRLGLAFIPSCWFIASIILAVAFSKFAHYLDDNGYGVINGIQGNLHQTIAEFRETSMYYIYLVYALQLVKIDQPLRFLKKTNI